MKRSMSGARIDWDWKYLFCVDFWIPAPAWGLASQFPKLVVCWCSGAARSLAWLWPAAARKLPSSTSEWIKSTIRNYLDVENWSVNMLGQSWGCSEQPPTRHADMYFVRGAGILLWFILHRRNLSLAFLSNRSNNWKCRCKLKSNRGLLRGDVLVKAHVLFVELFDLWREAYSKTLQRGLPSTTPFPISSFQTLLSQCWLPPTELAWPPVARLLPAAFKPV